MEFDRLRFVLGFLYEAQGRHVRDDEADLVESFFRDETDRVPLFARQLDALARERNLDGATIASEDGRTVFRGRAVAELINASYENVQPSPYLDLATGRPVGRLLRVSLPMFRDPRASLSYLAGAYARYGHDGTFRIPIAEHKVDVIARLLAERGCTDLVVTYHPTHVPRVYVLSCQRSPEVATWLDGARRT